MIKNTFCILDGIGEKRERRLWEDGVLTWEDFIEAGELSGFSPEMKRLSDESLFCDLNALNKQDAGYFYRRLKPREHWRLFDHFKGNAVCLDIETNGLQPGYGGYVTVVGLYDGYDYRCFVRGDDLHDRALRRELERYKYLITFFGAAFDIPFLLRTFENMHFNMPHFDLCFASRMLKIKGGLKRLENEFGITREKSVQGLNGYDAVRLWQQVKHNSSEALDLLVQYNREDTVNLMEIASIIYEKLRQSTGIEEYLHCGIT